MTSPQETAQSRHDWEPAILAVAPNGARKTKADHPALPMTPDEIAYCAASCADAGAAMIHLHVRDTKGAHTLDADAYRAAMAAIRNAIGDNIVIQATSEAVGIYTPAQQMAMVRDLRPEAVSLSVREFVPDAAHEAEAARFFDWLRKERILPQFIVYSAEDLTRFDDLVARGIVPAGRHFVLFVLGRYTAGQKSEPGDLVPFLTANRERRPWAICAFGAREAACATAAATLGGHVRVGFENNMLLPDGRVAPDNAALIAVAARGIGSFGRPVANAAQARELMVSYAWH